MSTEEALHRLNHKVAKEVELVACELNESGSVNGYAAGIRAVIFTSLHKLVDLDAPELRGDLERIRAYCDEFARGAPAGSLISWRRTAIAASSQAADGRGCACST